MSVYKGQWPEKGAPVEAAKLVTVDGQPLPPDIADVPGTDQRFGWGNFSSWATSKLLATSMLQYELYTVMKVPRSVAHQYVIDMADLFLNDRVARLARQWSMSSEEIGQWIKEKYPKIWEVLMSQHAPA